MALVPVRPPQLAFERRRGEVERGRSVQGQNFKITYFLEVSGAGESSVDVNFPVHFSEKPGVSFGGELLAGSVIEPANYPTCSVMVSAWKTDPTKNHPYYTGATLLLVVTGAATQRTALHFHAEGKALVAPA